MKSDGADERAMINELIVHFSQPQESEQPEAYIHTSISWVTQTHKFNAQTDRINP